MMTVILFLIVIVILVVIHELGHFLVAKRLGVRVDEFGVGYPPRAKKLFHWKGTLFTLNWLPFGGFVRIFGEQSGIAEEGAFISKPLWKRLAVVLGGIVANMLFAIFLYFIVFTTGFLGNPEERPHAIIISPQTIVVADVLSDSPAEEAGFVLGDTITEVDGISITQTEDVVSRIQEGGEITFMTEGKDITVTLKEGEQLGVALTSAARLRLPLHRALIEAFSQTGRVFVSIFQTLGSVIAGDKNILNQLSGPVGIATIAGGAYKLGMSAFLSFMALISINLAAINLLPIPALDGGRFILEFFMKRGESVVSNRVIAMINQVGMLLLILLMLYVTYKDIGRI